MPQAIYKVPDGKLLKVFLEIEGSIIQSITITGDFFVYPEEKMEDLEHALIGTELREEQLLQAIQTFVEREKLELFGVDAESLVTVIMMCLPQDA
jgi:lipoate-protein ligase A